MSKTMRKLVVAMTTTEAAEALGVSLAMASLIKTGARAVTLRRLDAFVAHVGEDVVDVVGSIREEAAHADRLAEQRRASNGG